MEYLISYLHFLNVLHIGETLTPGSISQLKRLGQAATGKTGKRLKDKVTVFNPASRKQTADRLLNKYPDIKFSKTEKGNTKLDDDVLEILGKKYPEAALLAKYQLLNKRLGQISEGKEAWVKHSTARS